MNDLSTAMIATEKSAEYDASVKVLLSDKQVLAWILKGTTTEYSAMSIAKIIPLIEDPAVSSVAVNPGIANGFAIVGMPQESKIPNEGVVYYDVRFFVKNPHTDGKKNFHIIVDIEAQRKPNPGYDLVTRGIFYCGRMLSEQSGRNFLKSDYDSLDKVYSIWICLNCSADDANTISRYSIEHDAVYGDFTDVSRHDLLQVVMVRLPNESNHGKAINEPSELHSMLYDLIVKKSSAKQRISILKDKYGIHMEDYERRMDTMCNLSQGLIEQGIEQGIEQERKHVIKLLLSSGNSPEIIHEQFGYPLEVIEEVQRELQTV